MFRREKQIPRSARDDRFFWWEVASEEWRREKRIREISSLLAQVNASKRK
jgi:hypothetical protein